MRLVRPPSTGEPLKLLLIRHAESQGNLERRLQGRREFPLTETGILQAKALASRLAGLPLAALYASPMRRAYETAAAVAAKTGVKVIEDERLQEYDFGDMLSGLTWQEIRERRPDIVEALRGDSPDFPPYPGEEGRSAFRDRICAALDEIIERHRRDPAVAVVTHAGPIVVYVMETLGRGYRRPIPFTIDNTSITTIQISDGGRNPFLPQAVVIGLNDTCHLHGLKAWASPVSSRKRTS